MEGCGEEKEEERDKEVAQPHSPSSWKGI